MEKYYNSVKELCKKNHLSDGKLTDEYLFTLWATNLFFFSDNMGSVDIKSGFVDGSGDGGIDFIHSDDSKMSLIQGKSSESISTEDIKNIFEKMIDTINMFEHKNTSKFSKKLRSAYSNAYDRLDDNKTIQLVLFTRASITDRMRSEFNEYLKINDKSEYEIAIYHKNDILEKDARNEQGDLVADGILILTNTNNFLKYGENGVIINVKASSIKSLYEKEESNGLFSYNLREHISQKNVDTAISNTIKTDKENFWYYNNGITIGCDDFIIDGYKLKLYDFSIINGAQTTTQIGRSKLVGEGYDFDVICKVVKPDRDISDETDFISKISESSNSQKPIRSRDLKSNAIEQKRLTTESSKNKYPLAIEIKRGVRPINYRSVEKWQRVSNEFIGQLVYSCILQKPGPARSAKNTLFNSGKVYKQVFYRNHDYDTLYDLVKISDYLNYFSNDFVEISDDINMISIVKNGKFTILAILFYLYKLKNNIVKSSSSPSLHDDNISGMLITHYKQDDLQIKLDNIFDMIVRNLNIIYETKKHELKITSYSNFFKTESTYTDVILPYFDNLGTWDKDKIDELMDVFE